VRLSKLGQWAEDLATRRLCPLVTFPPPGHFVLFLRFLRGLVGICAVLPTLLHFCMTGLLLILLMTGRRDLCALHFAWGCSQGLRAALNAMLFRTGDQSRDFILVLATNRPSDLDPAVIDRMDEALEFPLPGPEERRRILQIYLDRYIAKAGTAEGGDNCCTVRA
jgi:hypothetical protein